MVAHSKLHASEHAVAGGDDVHSYITHNSIAGLTTGDPHTQYAKVLGRATGQTIAGGTGASENLTLSSTTHGTKGKIMVLDELDMGTKAISNVGNVDGVDISAHAGGTAKSQHSGGLGDHTHQSSGAEGGQLDHGAALTGLGDDDHTIYLLATGTRALSGDMSMGGNQLTSVGDPLSNQDAATKAYVDSVATGVDWQESVLDIAAAEASDVEGDRYLVDAEGYDSIDDSDYTQKKFKHTGDVSTHYPTGSRIHVRDTVSNVDGYYTVTACSYATGITTVTVSESFGQDVAVGKMYYPDIDATLSWRAAGPDGIVTGTGEGWTHFHPTAGCAVYVEDTLDLWIYEVGEYVGWAQFGASLDHGSLHGLLDDDHTQYILATGTRAFGGHISHGGFNITGVLGLAMTGAITGVTTVDGVDVSTHDHSGANQGGTISHASIGSQLGGGSYHLSQAQYNALTSAGDIGATYHNHDTIYYRESEFVDTDTDAAAPVKTKAAGHLDDSLIKEICVVSGAEPAVPTGEVRIWSESGASVWLIYGTDGNLSGNRRVQLT
jgi:hypothetical protein